VPAYLLHYHDRNVSIIILKKQTMTKEQFAQASRLVSKIETVQSNLQDWECAIGFANVAIRVNFDSFTAAVTPHEGSFAEFRKANIELYTAELKELERHFAAIGDAPPSEIPADAYVDGKPLDEIF
jgi:hypothetical protein